MLATFFDMDSDDYNKKFFFRRLTVFHPKYCKYVYWTSYKTISDTTLYCREEFKFSL